MTKVIVKKGKSAGRTVRIGVILECSADDPLAPKFYRAIADCLKVILAPEQAESFLKKIARAA